MKSNVTQLPVIGVDYIYPRGFSIYVTVTKNRHWNNQSFSIGLSLDFSCLNPNPVYSNYFDIKPKSPLRSRQCRFVNDLKDEFCENCSVSHDSVDLCTI